VRRYRLWYCSSAGEGSNTSVEGGGAGEDTSDLCSIMGVVEGGEGGGCSSFILFSGWLIERDLTATLDGTRNLFLERGIKSKAVHVLFKVILAVWLRISALKFGNKYDNETTERNKSSSVS